jgi:hypothetical protein
MLSLSPSHRRTLEQFDRLPDDSLVADPVAAVVLGISYESLKLKNPVPRRDILEGRHGRRVGDLRALIRGKREQSKVA